MRPMDNETAGPEHLITTSSKPVPTFRKRSLRNRRAEASGIKHRLIRPSARYNLVVPPKTPSNVWSKMRVHKKWIVNIAMFGNKIRFG